MAIEILLSHLAGNKGVLVPAGTNERWRTSFHEAGHAIAATAMGIPVSAVAVCEDRTRTNAMGYVAGGRAPLSADAADRACLTRVSVARLADIPAGVTLSEYLPFLFAGGVAEQRGVGGPRSDTDWSDRLAAEQLVGEATHVAPWRPFIHPVLRVAEGRAQMLVAYHWNWIERTAHVLYRAGRLSGDAVRQLKEKR